MSCLTLGRASDAHNAARLAQAIDGNDPILLFLLSVCARREGDALAAEQFLASVYEL
jgi:hypothetical protein